MSLRPYCQVCSHSLSSRYLLKRLRQICKDGNIRLTFFSHEIRGTPDIQRRRIPNLNHNGDLLFEYRSAASRQIKVHSSLVSAAHPRGILDVGCNCGPDQETKEPRLPPELERAVFEIAALQDVASINRLILVAKRVKIW